MKSTNIIFTIIILALIIAGVYIFSINKKDEIVAVDESVSSDQVQPEIVDEDVMVKSGKYENYTVEKLSNADSGDVVLFFKASWCPSCRTVDADIKANINNIPETLTILELDYDKATDLKKKYGVTTQHTFVQVDKDGTMIKKWLGGSTLNSLIQEVI